MDTLQEKGQVLERLQKAALRAAQPGRLINLRHRDLTLYCTPEYESLWLGHEAGAAQGAAVSSGRSGSGAAAMDEAGYGAAALDAEGYGAAALDAAGAGGGSFGAVQSATRCMGGRWLYEPCFIFVLSGWKYITAGNSRFCIGPGEFFITCVPLPVEVVNIPDSNSHAFISLALRFDMRRCDHMRASFSSREHLKYKARVRTMAATRRNGEHGASLSDAAGAGAGAAAGTAAVATAGAAGCSAPPDDELRVYTALAADELETGRSTEVMACSYDMLCMLERIVDMYLGDCPDEVPFELAVNLMTYHLLRHPQAGFMILRAMKDESAQTMHKAVRFMASDLTWSFDAAQLAKVHGMDPYLFTRHFSAETGMTPLRWYNRIRLIKLRILMLEHKMSLDKALRVMKMPGSSQTLTAYRQFFGCPPVRDIKNLKKQLEKSGYIPGANKASGRTGACTAASAAASGTPGNSTPGNSTDALSGSAGDRGCMLPAGAGPHGFIYPDA